MRLLLGLTLVALFVGALSTAQQPASAPVAERPLPGKFVDITDAVGIRFNYLSSHTPKHYLPETMGAGVAFFDYDNDQLRLQAITLARS